MSKETHVRVCEETKVGEDVQETNVRSIQTNQDLDIASYNLDNGWILFKITLEIIILDRLIILLTELITKLLSRNVLNMIVEFMHWKMCFSIVWIIHVIMIEITISFIIVVKLFIRFFLWDEELSARFAIGD